MPESVFGILPTKEATTFKVTPVFFNIGINEKATISETLGFTREQHRYVYELIISLTELSLNVRSLSFFTDIMLLCVVATNKKQAYYT